MIRVECLTQHDCPIYHSCWLNVPTRFPYIAFVLTESPNKIAIYIIAVDLVSQHDCHKYHSCCLNVTTRIPKYHSSWLSIQKRLHYISFFLTQCPNTIAIYIIHVNLVFQPDWPIYHSCWLTDPTLLPYISFVLTQFPNTIALISLVVTQCPNTIALYIIRVDCVSHHDCPIYHSC